MPKPARWPPMEPTKDIGDALFLRGTVTRWAWRIYVQRLTPAGRWFLLVTALFNVYAGASLQTQVYVPAFYILLLWTVAIGALLLYRPKTSIAYAAPTRAGAGQTISIRVAVTQRAHLRGADLILVPHRLPYEISAVQAQGVFLPDLANGETAAANVQLRCAQRGSHILHGFRVESGFPFGILRSRQTFAQPHPLLVHPRFAPLSRLSLPATRRYQPGGIAMTSQLGESFEYLGNREYRDGDNPRDIDWRATARAMRPIVREWVEEYMLRAAVVLDTHIPGSLRGRAAHSRREDLERATSITAAVSDYMARQDYLVDLFAAGTQFYHLTAGRSLAYLEQILDILACVEENPDEPFDALEPPIAELIERLSTVIFVFLDWDEVRRDFATRLHRRGIGVKVIVVRDGRTTIDVGLDSDSFGEIPVITRQVFDQGVNVL